MCQPLQAVSLTTCRNRLKRPVSVEEIFRQMTTSAPAGSPSDGELATSLSQEVATGPGLGNQRMVGSKPDSGPYFGQLCHPFRASGPSFYTKERSSRLHTAYLGRLLGDCTRIRELRRPTQPAAPAESDTCWHALSPSQGFPVCVELCGPAKYKAEVGAGVLP